MVSERFIQPPLLYVRSLPTIISAISSNSDASSNPHRNSAVSATVETSFSSKFCFANPSTSKLASVARIDDDPNFASAILANPTPHPNSITVLSLKIDERRLISSRTRVSKMPLFQTATPVLPATDEPPAEFAPCLIVMISPDDCSLNCLSCKPIQSCWYAPGT